MNAKIREAAAQWLVEFRTDKPDVATRSQFAAWLCASPEHIQAYLEVLATWEDARCHDPQRRLDINALIALGRTNHAITDLWTDDGPDVTAAAAAAQDRNSRAPFLRKTFLGRYLGMRTAIAVVMSLMINGAVTWYAMDTQRVDYATQIAEQRSIQLTDGSRVDLDARSNVRALFSSHERTVELLSGQALFRVSKDAKRPFVVHVDHVLVRAVGTEFNVNRTELGTVVTVLEGRVSVFVAADSARSASVEVDAGQQTTIARGAIAVPQAADTAAATGWTHRVLMFASTPLAQAAEEFNRFNGRRVVIAGSGLADFRVTGTFSDSNPDSVPEFVLYLRSQPGLDVIEQGDRITVRSRTTR